MGFTRRLATGKGIRTAFSAFSLKMDSEGLHLNVDYVGSSGVILSPEQKAALQTSLVILQSENKFKKVYFWGRILGIKDDYYIAQGCETDEMVGRRTFYSKDCVH